MLEIKLQRLKANTGLIFVQLQFFYQLKKNENSVFLLAFKRSPKTSIPPLISAIRGIISALKQSTKSKVFFLNHLLKI